MLMNGMHTMYWALLLGVQRELKAKVTLTPKSYYGIPTETYAVDVGQQRLLHTIYMN